MDRYVLDRIDIESRFFVGMGTHIGGDDRGHSGPGHDRLPADLGCPFRLRYLANDRVRIWPRSEPSPPLGSERALPVVPDNPRPSGEHGRRDRLQRFRRDETHQLVPAGGRTLQRGHALETQRLPGDIGQALWSRVEVRVARDEIDLCRDQPAHQPFTGPRIHQRTAAARTAKGGG